MFTIEKASSYLTVLKHVSPVPVVLVVEPYVECAEGVAKKLLNVAPFLFAEPTLRCIGLFSTFLNDLDAGQVMLKLLYYLPQEHYYVMPCIAYVYDFDLEKTKPARTNRVKIYIFVTSGHIPVEELVEKIPEFIEFTPVEEHAEMVFDLTRRQIRRIDADFLLKRLDVADKIIEFVCERLYPVLKLLVM